VKVRIRRGRLKCHTRRSSVRDEYIADGAGEWFSSNSRVASQANARGGYREAGRDNLDNLYIM